MFNYKVWLNLKDTQTDLSHEFLWEGYESPVQFSVGDKIYLDSLIFTVIDLEWEFTLPGRGHLTIESTESVENAKKWWEELEGQDNGSDDDKEATATD